MAMRSITRRAVDYTPQTPSYTLIKSPRKAFVGVFMPFVGIVSSNNTQSVINAQNGVIYRPNHSSRIHPSRGQRRPAQGAPSPIHHGVAAVSFQNHRGAVEHPRYVRGSHHSGVVTVDNATAPPLDTPAPAAAMLAAAAALDAAP